MCVLDSRGALGSGCPPPPRDQQWALTFQCGFVVLYLGLKGHCISIVFYCFLLWNPILERLAYIQGLPTV